MDASQISTLISNVGFPIVCVIALFWRMMKEEEAHKAEAETWANVLRENTTALTELKEVVSVLKETIRNE